MRFLYRQNVARVVAVAAILYTAYYLWWRATSTLNSEALFFSGLLLAIEIQGGIPFVFFALMTWDVKHKLAFELAQGAAVDIFVPTYNEELDILEATLTGCNAVTYPHTTYLLDDGRRPPVEALARRMGCRYLTRPDNQHAKAGNINAALKNTDGEFIAVFDCDTVPQPNYLDRTLGYFVDPRVALVQLPQEFFNVDSVQHTSNEEPQPWHDQSLFYRVIQPGKNRWNAAFWCGSPSLVRRSALESVGGVATETIIEDIHTSVRLHSRGWRTVYHHETLAYGIAPQALHAFAVQRLRWAQGTMQLLRSRENPLFIPGLTPVQRANYLASMITYFDAFQKLVYMLTPSIVLWTGIMPLQVDGWAFFQHWLPYMALGMLANVALGRGEFRFLQVEVFNLLKMFTFIWASITLLWPKPLKFKVTPKSTDDLAAVQEHDELKPHLAVLFATLLSILVALVNFTSGLTAEYASEEIALMTLFWALVNATALFYGAHGILKRIALLRRQNYRFPIHFRAEVSDGSGRRILATGEDLSRYGASVVLHSDARLGRDLLATFELPDGPLTVAAKVQYQGSLETGETRLGLVFGELEALASERLAFFLYVVLPRMQRNNVHFPLGPDVVGKTFRASRPLANELRRLHRQAEAGVQAA